MADFSDEFTEASNTLLKNHTPNVGTAWVWTGTGDDGLAVGNGGDLRNIPDSLGATKGVGIDTISPELSSADQQVWGQRIGLTDSTAAMAVRLVDKDNCYIHNMAGMGGGGQRLSRVTSGTVTDLLTSQPLNNQWVKLKAEGTTISLWSGGTGAEPADPESDTNWTQIGVDQTGQTDHQTEVSCGFRVPVSNASMSQSSFRASATGGSNNSVIPQRTLLGVGV